MITSFRYNKTEVSHLLIFYWIFILTVPSILSLLSRPDFYRLWAYSHVWWPKKPNPRSWSYHIKHITYALIKHIEILFAKFSFQHGAKRNPPTLSLSKEQILLKADATCPSVSLSCPNTIFTGKKLDKWKSNYKKWSRDMRHYLTINSVLSYILRERAKPARVTKPQSYKNWIKNDCFTFTAIVMNVSDDDEAELDMDKGAKAAWDTLKERHQNEGPIWQVDLLHTALNMKCKKGTPLPQTCREICDVIDQVFAMGDFTADLFRCIAIINSLKDFPHIRSSILCDLCASTKEKEHTSNDIHHYLESEQTLHAATDKSSSTSDITLSTCTSHTKSPHIPTCSNCKRTGHTNHYCICTGGGMTGKTIQESKDAHHKDRENSRSNTHTKPSNNNGKIAVNVKDSSGKAFIIHVNLSDIPSLASDNKPEFAGIASDPPESLLSNTIKNIERCGWLAFEDEPKTSLDWNTHTKLVNIAAISEVSPLQQNKCIPISLKDLPFYINSGATVHISPEKLDFITLCPISACSVKGVGGSSITTIGLGDIKLRIMRGAHIILQNVLFIPNATVRLISVSMLACDSLIIAHFDEATC